MEIVIQQVINGIMLGSTYALVALGLTLVYGILHVPNFAHGHFYMLAGYITFLVVNNSLLKNMIENFLVRYWLSLIIAMAAMALGQVVLERLVFRPLKGSVAINPFMAAIGVMYVLENSAKMIWGSAAKRIDRPYPDIIEPLEKIGITITQQRLLVIVMAIVLIILLQLFIKKTTIGSATDALAQDSEGAALVGINVNRTTSLTFAIAGALAAAAATIVAPIFMITPQMGSLLILKAMVIIILGGMGSIPGAIIGAYILGLVESLGGGFLSADYKDVFAFGLLIIVLAVKPTGLFGREG